MSTQLFIDAFNSFFNQNRGGYIMWKGGLALPFSTIFYKKEPYSKIVENVIKALKLHSGILDHT